MTRFEGSIFFRSRLLGCALRDSVAWYFGGEKTLEPKTSRVTQSARKPLLSLQPLYIASITRFTSLKYFHIFVNIFQDIMFSMRTFHATETVHTTHASLVVAYLPPYKEVPRYALVSSVMMVYYIYIHISKPLFQILSIQAFL